MFMTRAMAARRPKTNPYKYMAPSTDGTTTVHFSFFLFFLFCFFFRLAARWNRPSWHIGRSSFVLFFFWFSLSRSFGFYREPTAPRFIAFRGANCAVVFIKIPSRPSLVAIPTRQRGDQSIRAHETLSSRPPFAVVFFSFFLSFFLFLFTTSTSEAWIRRREGNSSSIPNARPTTWISIFAQ